MYHVSAAFERFNGVKTNSVSYYAYAAAPVPCAAVCAPFKNSPQTYATCCKQHPIVSRPVTQLPKPAARPGQIRKVSDVLTPQQLRTFKGWQTSGAQGNQTRTPQSSGGGGSVWPGIPMEKRARLSLAPRLQARLGLSSSRLLTVKDGAICLFSSVRPHY